MTIGGVPQGKETPITPDGLDVLDAIVVPARPWGGPAWELAWSKLKVSKRFSGPNFRTGAEQLHEATRVRELWMRRDKSTRHAQGRFTSSVRARYRHGQS
jgi:hypothetical protein